MKKLKLFLKSKITTDTIALVIFSICASGGLTVLYELLIIDMTKGQWLVFRVLYNILKFSGAYFCRYNFNFNLPDTFVHNVWVDNGNKHYPTIDCIINLSRR